MNKGGEIRLGLVDTIRQLLGFGTQNEFGSLPNTPHESNKAHRFETRTESDDFHHELGSLESSREFDNTVRFKDFDNEFNHQEISYEFGKPAGFEEARNELDNFEDPKHEFGSLELSPKFDRSATFDNSLNQESQHDVNSSGNFQDLDNLVSLDDFRTKQHQNAPHEFGSMENSYEFDNPAQFEDSSVELSGLEDSQHEFSGIQNEISQTQFSHDKLGYASANSEETELDSFGSQHKFGSMENELSKPEDSGSETTSGGKLGYDVTSSENNQFEMGNLDNYFLGNNEAKSGTPMHIHYHGLLKSSGADVVYLHYSFDGWDYPSIRTEGMERQNNGCFEMKIQVNGEHEINYCFKDSANNWDNNNGLNWSVPLYSNVVFFDEDSRGEI